MSTVAFGALTSRREQSDSGTSKSDQPPGLNSYIDVLAALVPAEVLAVHAIIIAAVSTTHPHGVTQITQSATLRLAFWLLAGLAVALFVLGRQPTPTPAAMRAQSAVRLPRWQRLEWQDLIRGLIPLLAFVGWTMLEPTSVWNVVDAGMPTGTRMLIAMVGAIFLAALTKALATHSDLKLSVAELSQLPAPQQAAPQATATQPAGAQPAATQPAGDQEEGATVTVPPAPLPAPDDLAAADQPSVPKWVY